MECCWSRNRDRIRHEAIGIASFKVQYVGAAALWSAFLKGVGCNWLVNLAILLGICADDLIGKFFGIWFPIMAFVSTGFEHSIANQYFISAGIFTNGIGTAGGFSEARQPPPPSILGMPT